MPLSDVDILKEREQGHIIIEKFDSENLKNTMYDVTLGENYYVARKDNQEKEWTPCDETSIQQYWELKKADFADVSICEKFKNISREDKIIILDPSELILGHTQEFIGSSSDSMITTQMSSRSTVGRCGLRFCSCAGLGDVGYYNRWTMEIENVSKKPIILKVGMRVASITFDRVSSQPYDTYSYRGSYTLPLSVDNLIASWKPEMMLPRETF